MSDKRESPGLSELRTAALLREGKAGADLPELERYTQATIFALSGAMTLLQNDPRVPGAAIDQLREVMAALNAAIAGGDDQHPLFKPRPKSRRPNAMRKPETDDFYTHCITASHALFAIGRLPTQAAADRVVINLATPAAKRLGIRGWANSNKRKFKDLRRRGRIASQEFSSVDHAEAQFVAALDGIFSSSKLPAAMPSEIEFVKQWEAVAKVLNANTSRRKTNRR